MHGHLLLEFLLAFLELPGSFLVIHFLPMERAMGAMNLLFSSRLVRPASQTIPVWSFFGWR